MEGICLVIDNQPMYKALECDPIATPFDHDWLVTLAVGMWDHMQDQSDPVMDLEGWLRMHIPTYCNDLACYTAGVMGCSYSNAVETMVGWISAIVVNLVEIIEARYGSFLSPYIYRAGWTITAVRQSGDGTIIQFTQTQTNQIKTASASLLFRLEQLYRQL